MLIARFRNLSYAQRAGAIALLGLLVIAATTTAVVLLSGRALKDQARSRAQETARLSARLLEEQTRRLSDLVSAVAVQLEGVQPVDGSLSAQDEEQVDRALEAVNERRGIGFTFFAGPNGRVLSIAPPDPKVIGGSAAARDWYRGVRAGTSPYVSRAYRTEAFNRPRVVAIAAEVRTGGEFSGVLVATERGQTQRFVDAFARDQGTALTVIDQEGVIVAGSELRSEALISKAADPGVAAALRGRASLREARIDGAQTISAFAPVSRIGWVVRSDIRTDDAFADVRRIRLLVIGLALLFSVALIALATAFARNARSATRERLNSRLQAQLLPRVKLRAADLDFASLYRPGEDGMLIGGDFHDTVELDDGRVALVVGDVVGHGPDAAALGAALRAGWRISTLSGTGPEGVIAALDRAVRTERRQRDAFASAICAEISADRRCVTVCLAGHPPPLLIEGGRARPIDAEPGPLLGVMDDAIWPVTRIAPGGDWALLLYTDGLVEGSVGNRHHELEPEEALSAWVEELPSGAALNPDALAALVERARDESGGLLADDVALVSVATSRGGYARRGDHDDDDDDVPRS